jgi:hypothetical protein
LAFSQTKGVLEAVFAVLVEPQLVKTNAIMDNNKIFFIGFSFIPDRFLKPVRYSYICILISTSVPFFQKTRISMLLLTVLKSMNFPFKVADFALML